MEVDSSANTQRTLVVANSADPAVPVLLQQVGMACRYAKLALETFDLATGQSSPDLHQYSSLLLVCARTFDIHQDWLELLDDYVRSGGGLVVVNPQDNATINDLCGMRGFVSLPSNKNGQRVPDITTFLVDLFPAIKGLSQKLTSVHLNNQPILDNAAGVEIVATGASNIPVAWRRYHDAGRVFVWNTSLTAAESGRAFLVQSLLSVQDIAVKGIANVGMVQIDDFPAPFLNEMREPVKSEFNMPILEFLAKVWLPDMLQLADKYGIRYSFALPFTYNAITEKPFSFAEWDAETICDGSELVSYGVYFARRVSLQHELCLHGYNHIPLRIEHWGSREAMMASLQAALDKWTVDGLGAKPSCYVAPMNEYDRDGVLALTACLPSLKVICTERSNDRGSGGREFEPEPWNRELFCLPRLTYGYQLTDDLKISMVSTMAELGVWTHCMHPDDIFDTQENAEIAFPTRNLKSCGWRDSSNGAMKDHLQNWFEFAAENYPWLRYFNATQTGEQISDYLANKLEVVFGDGGIELRSDIPAFVQLRVNQKPGEVSKKYFDAADQSTLTILQQYQGATYGLWTLQIPAGTSKLKFN